MDGQIEQFRRAREFLAEHGMARNVRIQDVIAPLEVALTTTVNANQALESSYGAAGGFAGPLNNEGNMPTSSMGVIIGSAIVMPRLFVAGEELAIEGAWQRITQNASHVVRVAGTNVIARHATFSTDYSGLATGVAVGPIYGPPESNRQLHRQPEPTLVVGGGERVQQSLFFRRTTDFSGFTVTPELLINMVVADEGSD